MHSRLWCLCCAIPRPFTNLAAVEQHLAGAHGVLLREAVPSEQRRADGALVTYAQLADGRAALRALWLPPAAQAGREVLEVAGVEVCYDRAADFNHLAGDDRVLCGVDLAGWRGDCRYQQMPLLWSWRTCARCAKAMTLAGRGHWRGATTSEAAAAIWAARYTMTFWYALVLCEELDRAAGARHVVAARVLRAGVSIAVRLAEAGWQCGVVMESDPLAAASPIEAREGWVAMGNAACIVFDDSHPLTADRARADAADLLVIQGAVDVLNSSLNQPLPVLEHMTCIV
jgi:hypothetical protein